MRSSTQASRIIELASYLNSFATVNLTHSALIYESNNIINGQKQLFLMEADLYKNVFKQDFSEYMKTNYPVILNLEYTELGDNILPSEKVEEFENFFKENYEGFGYSIAKALKSFKFDPLYVASTAESIKIAKQDGIIAESGSYRGNWFANAARTLTNMATEQLVNKAIKEYYSKFSPEAKTAITKLSDDEIANKMSKYFFCSEFCLHFLRSWCKKININLPDMIDIPELNKQEPHDVYPQELYNFIKNKNPNYAKDKL